MRNLSVKKHIWEESWGGERHKILHSEGEDGERKERAVGCFGRGTRARRLAVGFGVSQGSSHPAAHCQHDVKWFLTSPPKSAGFLFCFWWTAGSTRSTMASLSPHCPCPQALLPSTVAKMLSSPLLDINIASIQHAALLFFLQIEFQAIFLKA